MKPISLFLLICLTPVFTQTADDWKPFTSKDGAFTVLFPGTPKEASRPTKSTSGHEEVIFYEVAVPPGNRYLVGYTEFPASAIKAGTEDKRLNNVCEAALKSVKGTKKREKSLLLDSFPGRELYIEVEGKSSILMRIYAVNNRLYEIVAIGSADFITSKDAAKFFDSFKLKK